MERGKDFEKLRETIIDCLNRNPDENALIKKLQKLVDQDGAMTCQVILHILTSLELPLEEAADCWQQILVNRQKMNKAIGRDVSLRTAICDFFHSIHKSLINPKVIEIHIYEKTLKDSNYDSLTGLFNRRYFDMALDREIALARRYDNDISLLFFDIDDFKIINDKYGHQVGDAALKQLAEIIVNEKRTGDIATRYGGEEIIMILPHTANVDALVLGERIRKKIQDTPLECEGQEIHLTVSGGLVSYPVDAQDPVSLLKYADTAMYRAKGSGKNNISFFSQDKRRYLRIDYAKSINIRELGFSEIDTIEGESKNICLGGLLFESQTPYAMGSKLQINIPINKEPLLVIGKVVRVESYDGYFDIGLALSFQEMDKIAKKEISQYLAKELKKD